MARIFIFISLIGSVLATGCGNRSGHVMRGLYPPENNYLPSKKFIIEKKDDHTILRIINPWQGAENITLEYYLVERGKEPPAGVDSLQVIFVPVRKIICMSTTHVAMISALGEENSISGISGTGLIYSGNVRKRIENGLVKEVGYEASLNNELILKISPDVIVMYGIGSESSGYVNRIRELGIKVLFDADYLETDPLGKAEWLKVFGAIYRKEKLADSLFARESEAYNRMKEYIGRNVKSRPKVLLGLPYKDTWYISPGNSYISRLISDAGGNYLWSDSGSDVSMPLGLENVYLRALEADYWLNIGNITLKEEIKSVDPRLTELPCYKTGNLYNNNNRSNISGGNDYWESGTIYPHLVLKDIAMILHPELFNDGKLFFYRKIY